MGTRNRSRTQRTGFTLVEMMIGVTVFAITTAISFPRVGTAMRHGRVNQAATVVAGDLEMALSLAARQRKPVRLTFTSGATSLVISDRNSGTILKERSLGANSDWKLTGVTSSSPVVDVYPRGSTSAPLSITLTADDYARRVTMSRAGLILVTP